MIVPPRPALARGRVRHVGDPVALVVADSRDAARDAAERVAVVYRELPRGRRRARGAGGGRAAALGPGAGQSLLPLRARRPGGCRRGLCRRGAMSSRSRSSTTGSSSRRSSPAPRSGAMTRRPTGSTWCVTGQGVHSLRQQLAESVFHVPAERVARQRARCRRRLRGQEFPLSRMGAGAVGGAPARPPGPLRRRARARSSSAPRRDATTIRPPGSRSTATAGFSPSTSTRSPISAPISRPTGRAARPIRRRPRWAGSTWFRPCSWPCAASSPTPCRSTPIAAPASPRRTTSSSG